MKRIIGFIDIPGFKDEHNTYISELVVLHGIIEMVSILEEVGVIIHGTVDVGCDRMSVLGQAFRVDTSKVSCKSAHYVQTSIICSITGKSRVRFNT